LLLLRDFGGLRFGILGRNPVARHLEEISELCPWLKYNRKPLR
jgi:hypothetical protein